MGLAELIRNEGANWTSGVVGMGLLKRGNTQAAPSDANEGDPCYPNTGLCGSDTSLSRRHILPFQQEIWDLAGNSAEVILETSSTNYSPYNYDYITNLSGKPVNTAYGTSSNTCDSAAGPEHCGLGKLNFTATGPVIWRGGAGGETNAVGVFRSHAPRNNEFFLLHPSERRIPLRLPSLTQKSST